MTNAYWRVRMARQARRDLANILRHTLATFGHRQLEIYRITSDEALAALTEGPDILGSVARDAIVPGMRSLHIARNGRRGRHFVLYRTADGRVIEVVRVLHDRMDLARHVPGGD